MKILNPFRTLQDVELGRIDISDAAHELNLTTRQVAARLSAYGPHLAFIADAYDALVNGAPPTGAARTGFIKTVAAKIGKSYRQTLRLMTEYSTLASPATFMRRAEESYRERRFQYNLMSLAAKVVIGLETIPELMTTSETDGIGRSTLYRAVNKMARQNGVTVRALRDLDPRTQEKLAEKIGAQLKVFEDEFIREQIERDKLDAKRLRNKRRPGRRVARPDAVMHA